MRRISLALAALISLQACGGTPFDETPGGDNGDGDGDGDGGPIVSDGDLPPGTASPMPNESIFRREPFDAESGSGFAQNIAYDSETDTFQVDNLAFDGDSSDRSDYSRGRLVGSLGPYAVYEADDVAIDDYSGRPVDQLQYRAIYGVSPSRQSEFAIVRTGGYVGYGFGGFVYQRDGGVSLPTTGQGTYSGEYAGIRDFDGAGGLEYTTADITLSVDFEDFNDGAGVSGLVLNRRIFDLAGNDLTQDVISAINAEYDTDIGTLPTIRWVIGPGMADRNGEILGEVFSTVGSEEYETGNYYAIVSGDHAEEIVGVLVVESEDPRFGGDVTTRETGGFIVTR